MAAAALSVRLNRFSPGSTDPKPPARPPSSVTTASSPTKAEPWRGVVASRRWLVGAARAGSRADDSAPFEKSVESALKLLGVSDGDSFDDILRAKNAIVASCEGDQEAIAQVEAAYDMLLMRSFSQRQAGKVADSSIRYADVKPKASPGIGSSLPQWMKNISKKSYVAIESPSTNDLAIQAGVYGALAVLTYVNGTSQSSSPGSAVADVPGLILAGSLGASLYFMTKKNIKIGKATVIIIGGLAAGALVGSAVENWLQVDIVPFLGIHYPATVVSEFIIFSQFLVSLCLR